MSRVWCLGVWNRNLGEACFVGGRAQCLGFRAAQVKVLELVVHSCAVQCCNTRVTVSFSFVLRPNTARQHQCDYDVAA